MISHVRLLDIRDPFTGEDWSRMIHAEAEAAAWLKLALRFRVTFWDIYNMVTLALADPDLTPDWKQELSALRKQIVADYADDSKWTLEQAVASWKRSQRYCELMAEYHPIAEQAAKYAASAAEAEARMTAIVNRPRRKVAAS